MHWQGFTVTFTTQFYCSTFVLNKTMEVLQPVTVTMGIVVQAICYCYGHFGTIHMWLLQAFWYNPLVAAMISKRHPPSVDQPVASWTSTRRLHHRASAYGDCQSASPASSSCPDWTSTPGFYSRTGWCSSLGTPAGGCVHFRTPVFSRSAEGEEKWSWFTCCMWHLGPNLIELLKQQILLINFLLSRAEMSRIPVSNCTCGIVVWPVNIFW